jgi:hypothetical protein
VTFTREQKLLLAQADPEPRLPTRHWNAQTAIAQIHACNFECEAGPLANNDAWLWLVMTYGTREPRTAAGSLD